MCLTIPAKVLSVEDTHSDLPLKRITIRDSKGDRLITALIPDINVGDWVLYVSDMAVAKISEDDAREILDLLEPKRHIDLSQLDREFLGILKACHTRELKREEIIRLLGTEDKTETDALFSEANTIRQANLKDFFCIHGIVEFSNQCIRNCFYCGLRRESKDVSRYRMTPDEIVSSVDDAVNRRGYKLIVLQSGDDFSYTDDILSGIIRRIKERCKVFIFMSVGERGLESYKRMKEAGASGVLFRFETSNKAIYDSIHPGQSYDDRIAHLRGMKEMGYYIATGFLIGLPGQTVADIADDIRTMKTIGANMVTVGPFIPSDGTPMASHPAGSAVMTLKVTAVARLLMPKAKIPVTTALETIESEEGRRLGLSSGANSLMFNLTPERHRGDYRIYPNKYHGKEEVWEKYGLFKEGLSYKMLEKKMFEAFEAQG
ncbi:MAG TPA: [FeFe] hydrogenase H-cluster radical SAM maturase HydE [Candidatus Wunengus sp. YC60]|uniref:[FeFe] hydrogenase H-cluster radical SAM maturase HydE n=1 Tax=Candidatus Wunengus sp. YC60 TaxID=3367697 RepID=UPI004029F296